MKRLLRFLWLILECIFKGVVILFSATLTVYLVSIIPDNKLIDIGRILICILAIMALMVIAAKIKEMWKKSK